MLKAQKESENEGQVDLWYKYSLTLTELELIDHLMWSFPEDISGLTWVYTFVE